MTFTNKKMLAAITFNQFLAPTGSSTGSKPALCGYPAACRWFLACSKAVIQRLLEGSEADLRSPAVEADKQLNSFERFDPFALKCVFQEFQV